MKTSIIKSEGWWIHLNISYGYHLFIDPTHHSIGPTNLNFNTCTQID